VLPECFIPLYPSNIWARGAAGFGGWDELWERLWANSVDVPGPLVDRLIDVCRQRDLFCVIGSVPQFIPAAAFPDDFPVPLPPKDLFGRGGAAVIEPSSGDLIAGPLYGQEGIVEAECDLRRGLHAKRWFDAVGHYSREDVLGQEAIELTEALE
jgi:hypothetical protein